MSKKLYPETDIQNIANAIRNLNGSSDTYTVSEMASAIALPENGYYLKESTEANPLSITDGEELNAQSCEVEFSPTQDLHGYDSPWIDSSEINSDPYLFRAVRGTATRIGNSLFDTLVGGTVAFNQLVKNGNFADTSEWILNDSTVSVSGNVLSFTGSSSGASMYQPLPLVGGHKYLKIGTLKLSGTPNKNVWLRSGKGNGTYDDTHLDKTNTNWQTIFSIFECAVSGNLSIMLRDNSTSDWVTILCKNFMVIDLTQMFGSAIADYIYSLEQATAGSGVAYFRSLFPKDYYEYNAGQLMSVKALSHKMVGFNQWDEEWEVGMINNSGIPVSVVSRIRSKNFIPVFPNTTYYSKNMAWLFFYENNTHTSFIDKVSVVNGTFTVPSTAHYMKFYTASGYGETYKNDICLNLHWDGERDGEYEAYEEHIYPLDSDLELRGIPKLDANNNLYYDGDTYESDGTVTRKYGFRAYQSGDEGLADAITDGTNTVYKLTTPTTETADAFENPQLVDNWGTEEYTDSREVQIPVGHETYHANICEISGWNSLHLYQDTEQTETPETTHTATFPSTVYGGEYEFVSGKAKSEWGYIASYNGETITEPWISDRDVYVAGTTPSTGAEVCYKLATPTTITLTPSQIALLENNNVLWSDSNGNVKLKYFSKSLN